MIVSCLPERERKRDTLFPLIPTHTTFKKPWQEWKYIPQNHRTIGPLLLAYQRHAQSKSI